MAFGWQDTQLAHWPRDEVCQAQGLDGPRAYGSRGMTGAQFSDWLRAKYVVQNTGYASECWLWNGPINHNGYAVGYLPGQASKVRIHRAAYEQIVGLPDQSLHIDHLCRVRHCVNPDHLEAVSPAENIRRGLAGVVAGARQLAKTHCPSGHEYTEANTYRLRNRRYCRTCRAGGREVAA